MTKSALISVSDKTNVVQFAQGLHQLGYKIISTGGTLATLQQAQVPCVSISDVTGFPECLDGRLKTLHPVIHGGILAMRDNAQHMSFLQEQSIATIDVVCVNLYPFRQTIQKSDCTLELAVENIDIGGPTMLRSAAKNYKDVLVVCDPQDYTKVLENIAQDACTPQFRLELMHKVFCHTAAYDALISQYMGQKAGVSFPNEISFSYHKAQDVRYGENPHQKAAFYKDQIGTSGTIADAVQLQGKELSFNNINDANGAIDLLKEFDEPACVAVKHSAPCGVAVAADIHTAYQRAYECDPISIFGGIVAVNGTIDATTAKLLCKTYLEIIIAPSYTEDALKAFTKKPNLRVLRLDNISQKIQQGLETKKVLGGLLVQQLDDQLLNMQDIKVVTKKQPTEQQLQEMLFCYKLVKHVKSNAITVSNHGQSLGMCGGQVNRIWAMEQALARAGDKAQGAILASDAFFPFDDCVEAAAKAGIAAIIQPGGSVRDQDSIDACDRHGIAMVFCGMRHFKH